jgi:hypothetical protein
MPHSIYGVNRRDDRPQVWRVDGDMQIVPSLQMPIRRYRLLLALALPWLVSACAVGVRSTGHAPPPAERAADPLQAWLAGHPDYRLLTDADCACPDSLKKARSAGGNPTYRPFRAVGDFNGDGKEDLAVGVAPPKDKARFRVLIFNDHKAPASAARAYLSPPLNRGMAMFFGPPAGSSHLLVGPFESEGVAFVPTGKGGYKLEDGV